MYNIKDIAVVINKMEFSKMKTNELLNNYQFIQHLPLVVKLKGQNKKLKEKIREMEIMVSFAKDSLATAQQMAQMASDQIKWLNRERYGTSSCNCTKRVQVKVEKVVPDVIVIDDDQDQDQEPEQEKENIVFEITEKSDVKKEGEEEEEGEEVEEEEEEGEEEEDEVFEVDIQGKVYYTTNEQNGTIYDVDENGDVSLEVGVYKDGTPTFYKK